MVTVWPGGVVVTAWPGGVVVTAWPGGVVVTTAWPGGVVVTTAWPGGVVVTAWPGGVVVTAVVRLLAHDTNGHGFDSRSFHFQLTTLGKLFTHACLCHKAV